MPIFSALEVKATLKTIISKNFSEIKANFFILSFKLLAFMKVENLLKFLKEKREQIIFAFGIVLIVIIILIYNNLSSKRVSADSQVAFIQGFYGIQFGDTSNAPKILMELYSRNKSNFIGFWSGLVLADYYYKFEKKDNSYSILKTIKPFDEIGKTAYKILEANLKSSPSSLNIKTDFKSINNYVAYRKAKMLLAKGDKTEAIRLFKEISKGNDIFSEMAKEELRALGEKL